MAEIRPFYGPYDSSMKLADGHIHTENSDGTWGVRKTIYEAKKRGLSGLFFTDHDVPSTGYEAREIAARENIPIEILPGVEVSARGAHMFAFFPKDTDVTDIPMHQSIQRTAEFIVRKGGLVGFPHPEYRSTESATFEDILQVAENGMNPFVEVMNASANDLRLVAKFHGRPDSNLATRDFYDTHKDILGAAIAGTDAHFRTVGRGLVAYEGELEEALRSKSTSVVFSSQGERMFPWDLITHAIRQRRMEKRREERYRQEQGVLGEVVFSASD